MTVGLARDATYLRKRFPPQVTIASALPCVKPICRVFPARAEQNNVPFLRLQALQG